MNKNKIVLFAGIGVLALGVLDISIGGDSIYKGLALLLLSIVLLIESYLIEAELDKVNEKFISELGFSKRYLNELIIKELVANEIEGIRLDVTGVLIIFEHGVVKKYEHPEEMAEFLGNIEKILIGITDKEHFKEVINSLDRISCKEIVPKELMEVYVNILKHANRERITKEMQWK